MGQGFDPVLLGLILALMALIPLLVVVSTSFLKIAVVLMIVRNALGVQQVPPNMALYGIALAISLFIMAPVLKEVESAMQLDKGGLQSAEALLSNVSKGIEPFRKFMIRNGREDQRRAFVDIAKKTWPTAVASQTKSDDLIIVLPAFVVSQLIVGFELGFLLYLPFVVVDLVVSNVLLALGMMMVSPMTISLPLKLLLFVTVDGWSRLLHGMALSYI